MGEVLYFCYTKKVKRKYVGNMFEKLVDEIKEKRHFGYDYQLVDMEDISRRILEELDSYQGDVVPIVEIAKRMGFKIYQSRLESKLSGFIAVDEKIKKKLGSDKVIFVNINDELGHQRFVIAHELAHYLFDYDMESDEKEYYNTYFKNSHKSFNEIRANQFAANLLMPREQFLQELKSIELVSMDSIKELQKKFEVQEKAIFKRILEV